MRQKEKLGENVSLEKKKELMAAVKDKRSQEVQKIAAQMLDLPLIKAEKIETQADASVRLEMSLSKEEMEVLQKAKELLGHVRPGMTMKELVVLMAQRLVVAKDPAREVRQRKSEIRIHTPGVEKGVSAGVRRKVFQRDQCCQWVDPVRGRKCGGRPHIEFKYRMEAGIKGLQKQL